VRSGLRQDALVRRQQSASPRGLVDAGAEKNPLDERAQETPPCYSFIGGVLLIRKALTVMLAQGASHSVPRRLIVRLRLHPVGVLQHFGRRRRLSHWPPPAARRQGRGVQRAPAGQVLAAQGG
jgi:hypothetical protein